MALGKVAVRITAAAMPAACKQQARKPNFGPRQFTIEFDRTPKPVFRLSLVFTRRPMKIPDATDTTVKCVQIGRVLACHAPAFTEKQLRLYRTHDTSRH